LSPEVFFLLNFFVVEGSCEVFGLQDLANLYVGVAFVGVRAVVSSTPRGNMARESVVPVSHKAVTASSGHSGGSFRTICLAALNLRAGHLRLSS